MDCVVRKWLALSPKPGKEMVAKFRKATGVPRRSMK